MNSDIMISGKYFLLEKDNRFPLVLPTGEWQNLTNKDFISPTGCSIYLLSGHSNLYVGSDGDGDRVYDHIYTFNKSGHRNPYMQSVVNKYGLDVFYYQPLVEIPNEYVVFRNQIENSYIRLFDTYHNGYNMCEFANSPNIGKKLTAEHKKKISDAHKGENNYFYGKHHTEETKRKLSIARKGTKVSEDTRTKMSHAMTGERNPFFGKKHTQVTRDAISKNKEVKKFTLVSPDGIIFSDENITRFARKHNLDPGALIKVLDGKIPNHKGWRSPKLENMCKYEDRRLKEFCFISPEGKIVKGKNLFKFCRDNDIDYDNLRSVKRGRQESYLGWTKYVEENYTIK